MQLQLKQLQIDKGEFMKNLILIIMGIFFAGCTSLKTVSLTSIPVKRDKEVRAETSRFIFLGFNFDNDYVDLLVKDLRDQCPNGVVSGVLTKDELTFYFLAHRRKITATGYCIQAKSTASIKKGPRKPSSELDSESDSAL